ncbi:hypothetical protein ACMAUO_20405 [Gluconacetobacter sp. Hr-1-5]|uniref:hypothetical protein n=1 Tax=Gluconacetobacter sp. Hr-1-5 TaxID=3395370 RepID=UPI003B51A3A9
MELKVTQRMSTPEALPNGFPTRSPEQHRQHLVEALAELRLMPFDLAAKMEKFGDDRTPQAINRSIQRMLSGETNVSPEMTVIVSMLLRQQQRLKERHPDLKWEETPHGAYHTNVENWHVYLSPQTRGRWILSCAAGQNRSDYSPPFGRWLDTLDEAKHKALVEIEEGMNDLAELNHERRKRGID